MSAIEQYLHYIHNLCRQLHFFCVFRKVCKIFISGISIDCFVKSFTVKFCAILKAITYGTLTVIHSKRYAVKVICGFPNWQKLLLNIVSLNRKFLILHALCRKVSSFCNAPIISNYLLCNFFFIQASINFLHADRKYYRQLLYHRARLIVIVIDGQIMNCACNL